MIRSIIAAARFFACFFGFSVSVFAAVTLDVAPSAVSNTYSDNIVISITGLTNRESIILEQYLDLNGDGVIAPTEPMTQRLLLTDGVSAPLIASVQNANIPGDNDGKANGQITVRLPFPTEMELNRIVGTFRFRVSSPTSRFSKIEKVFTVTQAASSQSITGTIYNAGSPLSNAIVTLVSPETGFVAGTVADALGRYSLATSPGNYLITAFKPAMALVGNQVAVSVPQAKSVALDLTNTAAIRTISGYIKGTSGTAISGLQILLTSVGGQTTTAFSDKTGFFTVAVAPDKWTISPSENGLARIGYTSMFLPPVVDTTVGNVSTNLLLPSVTSLIYGTLTYGTNVPIAGLRITASESQYRGVGTTDSNGTYVIGATSGYWSCQPEPNLLKKAGFVGQGTNVFVYGNKAARVDFIGQPITAHLLGQLVQDNGLPVQELAITAKASSDYTSSAVTDSNGNFDLSLYGETWRLQADPSQLSERSLLAPTPPLFTINDGATNTGFNYQVRNLTSIITGRITDTNGLGIGSVPLKASTTTGELDYISYGTCDTGGNFTIKVFNAEWSVDVGDLAMFGYQVPASQVINVSNSTNVVNFVANPLPPLGIEDGDLPVGSVGTPYSFQLRRSGGAPPYSWSISSGSLPPGLSLADSGIITGIPAHSTNAILEIEVMDFLGNTASNSFSMSISPSSLTATAHPGAASIDLQLTGESRTHIIEFATQLSGPWTPISTNQLTGTVMILNVAPTNSQMFYRAKAQ